METNEKKPTVNIVVLDGHCANPGDLSWDGFKELGSLTVYERTKADEVVERAKDAQIVLVNKVSMKADIIAQLPKLKYIGVLATGFNHIDVKAAQEHGVTVCNIPSYSTCLLYTSPSPRDVEESRMPSSA